MSAIAAAKFTPFPAVHITPSGARFEGSPVQRLSPPGQGVGSTLWGRVHEAVNAVAPRAAVDMTRLIRVGTKQPTAEWVAELDLCRCDRLAAADVALAVRASLGASRALQLRHGLSAGIEALRVTVPQWNGVGVEQEQLTAACEGSGLGALVVTQGTNRYEWPGFAYDYSMVVEVAPAPAAQGEQGDVLWQHMQTVGHAGFRIILQGLQVFTDAATRATALWNVLSPLMRGNLTAAHWEAKSEAMSLNAVPATIGAALVGFGIAVPALLVGPVFFTVAGLAAAFALRLMYERAQDIYHLRAQQLNPLKGALDIAVMAEDTGASNTTELLNVRGLPRVDAFRDQPLVTYHADHPVWADGAFRAFGALWKDTTRRRLFQPQPVEA